MHKTLPQKLLKGAQRMFDIEHVLTRGGESTTMEGERQLYSLLLPPWQRPPVWTLEQQTRYVENVFLGYPPGQYVTNGPDYENSGSKPMSGWLIDGQQRITALGAFWQNKLPVFGSMHFDDLSKSEQRNRFMHVTFPALELDYIDDEQILKDIYYRLAFGGTAHTKADLERLQLS